MKPAYTPTLFPTICQPTLGSFRPPVLPPDAGPPPSQPSTPKGSAVVKRKQMSAMFGAQYTDRYHGSPNVHVHPTIGAMMIKYLEKYHKINLRIFFKDTGINFWNIPSLKHYDGKQGQLKTCTHFQLRHCSDLECEMAHIMRAETYDNYITALMTVLGPSIAKALTKKEGGGSGKLKGKD